MSDPEKAEPLRELGPHADDAEDFRDGAGERVLDVDVAGHLRWLETGEGDPWPPASSS